MAAVARRDDTPQLNDRKAGFLFQQSHHAIQIMNCSLDQLLNLHSYQTTIAHGITVGIMGTQQLCINGPLRYSELGESLLVEMWEISFFYIE